MPVPLPPPPRIVPPTPAEFERVYVRRGQPVIITGAIERWPARTLWSADYLKERYGALPVSVARTTGGSIARDPRVGIQYEEMPVRDAVDRVFSGEEPGYYLIATLESPARAVLDDVIVPAYCGARPRLRSRLWVSAPGTISPLHRDYPDNLFAQVIGKKRFTILPPGERRRVYEHSFRSRLPRVAAVDPERPDYARHPRYAGARVASFDLQPGELLYLPGRWWHHVRSLDPSFSINWWWAEGLTRLLVTAADVYKRIRSVRL